MNIFDELRQDHDRQRRLIAQLVDTEGASEARKDGLARVADALRDHAAAEERHFYAPLMRDDLTQDKARHSVHEHEQLDDLLEKLESYELTAPAWLQTAQDLEDKLSHHLQEEEREAFPMAGKVLTESEKSELAVQYRAMMNEA